MPRSVLAVVVAALAVTIPAAAWGQGPKPTLTFDQPCYSPGDRMGFSGTGYTPGGAVRLFFNAVGTQRAGSYDTQADPSGAIAGGLSTPDPDAFLDDDELRHEIGATGNDQTRIGAGAPPDQQFGATSFTLSRFGTGISQPSGARPRAAKRMRVTAVGFTNARGEMLYLHYRRGGRTAKTVKVGRLAGACGDVRRTLSRGLPRGLKPGTWTLVFNTSARSASTAPSSKRTLSLR